MLAVLKYPNVFFVVWGRVVLLFIDEEDIFILEESNRVSCVCGEVHGCFLRKINFSIR